MLYDFTKNIVNCYLILATTLSLHFLTVKSKFLEKKRECVVFYREFIYFLSRYVTSMMRVIL